MSIRLSVATAGAVGVTCLLACSSSQQSRQLTFQLSGQPAPATGCASFSGSTLTSGTLRLSVVKNDASGPSFVCDAVAQVPTDTPNFDLGAGANTTYDIYAELYQDGARAATGAFKGLTAQDTQGAGTLPIQLYRAAGWSCPQGLLSKPRAFHSATVLPGGQVLLIGGLSELTNPLVGGGPSIYQVLNTIELYDPITTRFQIVTPAQGEVRPGRAFHQAVVIETTSQYVKLMVYGGIVAAQGRPALNSAAPNAQFPFAPTGTAQPGGAEIVFYYPATVSEKTLPVGSLIMPAAAFAGGAGLPSAMLAAGGAQFPEGKETDGTASLLMPNMDLRLLSAAPGADPVADMAAMLAHSTLPLWLSAPTVTLLKADTALVLGASRTAPGAMTPGVQMSGLLVGGLPKALMPATAQAMQDQPTVFHTATRLTMQAGQAADPGVLVTGGLVLQTNPIQAKLPPAGAQAVRVYQQAGSGMLTLAPVTAYGAVGMCGVTPAHYHPAAFEAATATVLGQRVLLTGGSPAMGGCNDCDTADSGGQFCVLKQVSLYDVKAQMLSAGPALGVGRMGHQQTLLGDGNILVSGGLYRPTATAVTPATAEVEVYNPQAASVSDSTDDPLQPLLAAQHLTRQPMQSAKPCSRVN